jgi:periodic tryptophan protein 1
MFVHHDISLPDFPICLAWMDCPPFRADGGQETVGSYVAVGAFNPAIEIWNLDVLDPLEPSAVLGGIDPGSSKPKKGGKKLKESFLPGSHEDAVMGLSWNRNFRQALASGSADKTAKIWDVTTQQCSHTFRHHADKVQSVLWHPTEGWLLASGSFDKTVTLMDCRAGSVSAKYSIGADIESLAWDPHCSYHLYCATEDGMVTCFDSRFAQMAAFKFQAHGSTVSSLSFCPSVPGLLATASIDKTVRVWDVHPLHKVAHSTVPSTMSLESYAMQHPSEVAYKSMAVGKLFSLQFHGEDAFVLATGGDKGMVAVWESDENEIIKKHFGSRAECERTENTDEDGRRADASSLGRGPLVIGSLSATSSEITKPAAVGGSTGTGSGGTDDSWMDEPCKPVHHNNKIGTKKKNKNKK